MRGKIESNKGDERLRDLIEIIQFVEKVSTKIHGMFDEAEIYRVVMEEFKKSRRYTASIVLLTDDGMKLRIAATSLSPEKLKVGERAAGLQMNEYTIDLNKSSIYRQVVKEGKTVHVSVSDIIGELFPRPLAHLISKTMGYEKKKSIMVPLRHHEKIIGIFAMTSTELAEYFIPSVRDLAQRISTALELADEHAERKQTEEEKERVLHNLGERVKELNYLYGLSKLVERPNVSLEKIFRGAADLIPFSWQYPNITCTRIVFENKEFKTDNFRITKWKQSADVKVYGKTSGTIEIYYLEEKPEIDEGPFLKEERDLLESIAERLGHIIEHKKAEEALKVSKEFSENLIASTKDGFSILDRHGVHMDVNPALCQMTGFSREELIGTGPPHLYWPEEEYEDIEKSFQKTLRGEFEDFELIFKRKNGERFPVIVSPSQVTDEKGDVISYFAAVKDITKQKKMEEELQASEQNFKDLTETTTDWIWEVDKDGVYTYVSPKVKELLGYEISEVLGKTPFDLMPEEEAERVGKIFKEKVINKKPFSKLENVNRHKGGHLVVLETNGIPIFDEKGRLKGYRGIDRDITERKKAEEELKKHRYHLEKLVEERAVELTKTNKQLQQEIIERKKAEGEIIRTKEHLQNIINSASEIVISFDNNNRVTTWNKTAELLTRFKQREVIGRHVTKLPIFDNPQELLENLKGISYGKKHGFDALVLTTKDNTKRILKISCSAIKSDKDQPRGVLCVGKDITHDVESHGMLLKGNSYLISDKSNRFALEFFAGLNISGYKGLFITRATPEIIKSTIRSKDVQVVLLKQNKSEGFENIQDLDGLTAKIKEFSRKNTDSVILLDGVHYLLTRFSFEKFAQTLYQIKDMISENKSILLFHLDPSLVDRRQMAIIENELQPLPSQKIDAIEIEEELYDILKFIYEQNQKNSLVSFKKISKEFSIVKSTSAKRLRMLEDEGLILVKKRGRSKTLYVSEKGKTLLNKRQTI